MALVVEAGIYVILGTAWTGTTDTYDGCAVWTPPVSVEVAIATGVAAEVFVVVSEVTEPDGVAISTR